MAYVRDDITLKAQNTIRDVRKDIELYFKTPNDITVYDLTIN